jgi:hypothetical protein
MYSRNLFILQHNKDASGRCREWFKRAEKREMVASAGRKPRLLEDHRSKKQVRRMPSSRMLRHVALVRTDISEELSASIIRVTRISKLGTLAVTNIRLTLRRNTKRTLGHTALHPRRRHSS